MKYIKLYEDTINDRLPQLYDYVICQDEQTLPKYNILNDFLSKNIGQIVNSTNLLKRKIVIVHYPQLYTIDNNLLDKLEEFFILLNNQEEADQYIENPEDYTKIGKGGLRGFIINEIVLHDRDKESIQLKIDTSKYNL